MLIQKLNLLLWGSLVSVCATSLALEVRDQLKNQPHLQFVPARLGDFPDCHIYGRTYCLDIPDYPMDLIEYLLRHNMFNLTTVFLNEGDPSHEAVDLAELLQRANDANHPIDIKSDDISYATTFNPTTTSPTIATTTTITTTTTTTGKPPLVQSPMDVRAIEKSDEPDEYNDAAYYYDDSADTLEEPKDTIEDEDDNSLSLISNQRLKLNSLKERVENLIYRQMDKGTSPSQSEIEEEANDEQAEPTEHQERNEPDLVASKSSTYYQNYLAKKIQRELESVKASNPGEQDPTSSSRNSGSHQTLFRTGGHEESALSLEDLDVNSLFGNGDDYAPEISPRDVQTLLDSSELQNSVLNQILNVDQIEFGSRTVPLNEPDQFDASLGVDYGSDYGDVSAGDDVRLSEFLFRPNVSSSADQRAITATVIEIRSSVSDSSDLESALGSLEHEDESYHLDKSLEDPVQDIEEVIPNANRRIDVEEVDFQDPEVRYTSSDRIRIHLPQQNEPRSGKTQIKQRVLIRKPLNARQPVFREQSQGQSVARVDNEEPQVKSKTLRYRRPVSADAHARLEKARTASVLRQRVSPASGISENSAPLRQSTTPRAQPSNSRPPPPISQDPPTRIVYQDFNTPAPSLANFPVLSLTSLPPDFFELKPMRSPSNLMPLRNLPIKEDANVTTVSQPDVTIADNPTTESPPDPSTTANLANPFLRNVKTTDQPHFEGVNEAPETISTNSNQEKTTPKPLTGPQLPPNLVRLGPRPLPNPPSSSLAEPRERIRVPIRGRPTPYQPNFSDQLPSNRRHDDEPRRHVFKGPFNIREPPHLGVQPDETEEQNQPFPHTTYDPNLDDPVFMTESPIRSQTSMEHFPARQHHKPARPRRPRPRVTEKRLPKPYSGPFAWLVKAFSPSRTPRLQTRRQGRSRKLEAPKKRSTCPTRKLFIRPRVAFSVKGQWMYIVNLPRGPAHQRILSEECLTDHCQGGCAKEHSHKNQSLCELQFVQKRLVALAIDGKRLISELFWIPSTCKCQTSEIQW